MSVDSFLWWIGAIIAGGSSIVVTLIFSTYCLDKIFKKFTVWSFVVEYLNNREKFKNWIQEDNRNIPKHNIPKHK